MVEASDMEEPVPPSTTAAATGSASPLMMDLAASYKRLAEECESAALHARRAASRFIDNEPVEGAAHAFASQGHLHRAGDSIKRLATQHAEHHQKD
ncbi:MAG: hypothetical protein GEU79_06475 [Acidimicrobiia bacterium]|nr:hypothetical protein [Acidimicrobiia bacterium]